MCMFLMAMRGEMILAFAIRLPRQRQALLQTWTPGFIPPTSPTYNYHTASLGIPGSAVTDLTIIPDLPQPDLCSH